VTNTLHTYFSFLLSGKQNPAVISDQKHETQTHQTSPFNMKFPQSLGAAALNLRDEQQEPNPAAGRPSALKPDLHSRLVEGNYGMRRGSARPPQRLS